MNFHTNTLIDKLSAGCQGNRVVKLAQNTCQGRSITNNLTIWQDMTPLGYYTFVSPVQFRSKHNISERPSSEKPCVRNISPHSCFIGNSNIINSQQSLYVPSQHEWCHITAWVTSHYCMSDVISLINTEKNLNAFEFKHFTKPIELRYNTELKWSKSLFTKW